MVDFFKNNYEWIFSGIGVIILGGLFSIFKKSKTEKVKKNNQKVRISDVNDSKLRIIQNQNITTSNHFVNNISEIHSETLKEKDTYQQIQRLDANNIWEDIENSPPYQQDEIKKHYIGIKVSWEVEYYSIPTKKDDIITVMSQYKGELPWIFLI